jgi:RluA family pseudouridine synthase
MDILHQDDHIIVLNKPAGLSVLPEGWDPEAPYLRQMLEEEFGQIWVVHRLDKVTSGVMVFALTAEAHRRLNRQFERHEVEKVYQAIVEGVPPWNVRNARHMLRTNVGRKHRTVVVHKRGKNSETDFKVLKRGHPVGHKQASALIEARPKTGRTHQVRVHLSALGFPILDDTLYGASESELIERPALHAYSLGFTHPISGEHLKFIANPPTDFQEVLKRLGV